MFCKKYILKNSAKFAGKHPCLSVLFNKVAGLSPVALLKKRPQHRCSPVNFAKFLRTPVLQNTSWLLNFLKITFKYKFFFPEFFFFFLRRKHKLLKSKEEKYFDNYKIYPNHPETLH